MLGLILGVKFNHNYEEIYEQPDTDRSPSQLLLWCSGGGQFKRWRYIGISRRCVMKLRVLQLVVVALTIVLGIGETTTSKGLVSLPKLMHRPMPPHQIRIGDSLYTVKFVSEKSSILQGVYVGLTCDAAAFQRDGCTELNTIYLAYEQSIGFERASLVHEIQHGILGTNKSDDVTTYHDAIRKVTPGLVKVIQDNPKLLSYLTAPVPLGM